MDRRDFGKACIGMIAGAGVSLATEPSGLARCVAVRARPSSYRPLWTVTLEYDDDKEESYLFRAFRPAWCSDMLNRPRAHNRWSMSDLVI